MSKFQKERKISQLLKDLQFGKRKFFNGEVCSYNKHYQAKGKTSEFMSKFQKRKKNQSDNLDLIYPKKHKERS